MMTWLFKGALCLISVALAVYLYIDALNGVIELRLQIPQVQKAYKEVAAENQRLQYEIDRFESPLHLMELSRKPEFSHLKSPYLKDVIVIESEKTQ